MKATKQKSGKWRVQLYLGKDPNGKKIIKSFTAPTKRAAMDAAMERASKIELNLSETLYVSSSGLRVIMAAVKQLGGSSFKVTHVNAAVMEVFDVTGLNEAINVEADELEGGSNIKALFFDVDGTLLSHKQGIIPQSAIDAIKAAQAKGVKARKVNIKKAGKLKKVVRKLKAGKKYSFKVRAFTKVENLSKGKPMKVYGKWSNVIKKVKIRK